MNGEGEGGGEGEGARFCGLLCCVCHLVGSSLAQNLVASFVAILVFRFVSSLFVNVCHVFVLIRFDSF